MFKAKSIILPILAVVGATTFFGSVGLPPNHPDLRHLPVTILSATQSTP